MARLLAVAVSLAMLLTTFGVAAATEHIHYHGTSDGYGHDPTTSPNDDCTYYVETGHNLCAGFRAYWESQGGLAIFGYPITEEFVEDGMTVQYFERARFEWQPGTWPARWDTHLGLLGNVYAAERDLLATEPFAEAEPQAGAIYFAETGHNLAAGFRRYWEHYGGLAIFGYPISEEFVEDGLVVQYFERQRFEWHPDEWPERWDVMLGLLGTELYGITPGPQPVDPFTVVAEGLDNPRHMAFDSVGGLYVVQTGQGGDNCETITDEEFGEQVFCVGNTGKITRIWEGVATDVVTGLPSFAGEDGSFASGAHAVALDDEDNVYVLFGEGAPPIPELGPEFSEGFGTVARIEDDGSLTEIADLIEFEMENNPDGLEPHSNPYDIIVDGDNIIVTDAGANTLLQIDSEGNIEVLAVIPTLGEGEGAFQAVPTSVAKGPDGAYYVGELTGNGSPAGSARVWRVVPGEEPEIYEEGFTAIIDIAFDEDGNLYVLQIINDFAGFEVGDFSTSLYKVTPDGTRTVIASEGLMFPTGVEVDSAGQIYVSNMGTMVEAGQVVRLNP